MPTTADYINLARSLPPQLIRFFTKYPPGKPISPISNPFTPTKVAATGRWMGPRYSLRRQADICKLARTYGVEELLPHSKKSAVAKEERRELGKTMKGMDKVKGHAWERHLASKLEARKQAMENMPQLIDKWKRSGHGRGWKNWPK
ncbi:hypothetical protein BJ508DRAFT_411093 [Ascobolus immersus RN42]|uniref:Large ribosomal subunit protein mL59 domain-containing protein n=1 Tax=Ascobolus immersus RN42 TaxID=1160509 RepID=A0A3N4ILC6_ASCIM|nr:hypothetical protein BJ508DRAFT_411093 [Ascobolus immersus RN42]